MERRPFAGSDLIGPCRRNSLFHMAFIWWTSRGCAGATSIRTLDRVASVFPTNVLQQLTTASAGIPKTA